MRPKIAAVQLNSSSDIAENLNICAHYIEQAKQAECSVVLLPENFAWMGDEQLAYKNAEPLGNGPIQDFLSQQAKRHRISLIGGGHKIIVPSDSQNRYTNSALAYNADGVCISRYDKVHLFDSIVSENEAYLESKTTVAGNRMVCVDTPAGRIGLSICYDLRFPHFFAQLRALGADTIVVPSAFTVTTGKAHWETLLRARAIENQVYIIAAAQVGHHPGGRTTYGHTLSVNGWGKVTASLNNDVGLITQEINLDALKALRNDMPVWSHKREDLR